MPLRRTLDDIADARAVFPRLETNGKTPQPIEMLDDLVRRVGEGALTISDVAKLERTVAIAIVANDLHVRDARFVRVLPGQQLAQAAIAVFVMDAVDNELVLVRVVGQREEAQLAYQAR